LAYYKPQRTCLVIANVVLPRWKELTTLPQIHLEAGTREGQGRKRQKKERKEGVERTEEHSPPK